MEINLVTQPEYPPTIARQVWQYSCRTVFPALSQTIAAYRNPETDLTRGGWQKKSLPLKPIAQGLLAATLLCRWNNRTSPEQHGI